MRKLYIVIFFVLGILVVFYPSSVTDGKESARAGIFGVAKNSDPMRDTGGFSSRLKLQ